jgi:hypothetical protein
LMGLFYHPSDLFYHSQVHLLVYPQGYHYSLSIRFIVKARGRRPRSLGGVPGLGGGNTRSHVHEIV